jgi:2-aminophenol/2-amino-5-chlorophenol 1,6-dioxygenase subunit alpha
MTVVGAAMVPGMPHLLAAEPAPSWKLLAEAARQAGQDLRYDLRVDVELAQAWACQAEDMGFQDRPTRYDGFPVDTGTVVAGRLVDPDRSRPIALVSCNLSAAAGDLGRIAGAAWARVARGSAADARAAVAAARRAFDHGPWPRLPRPSAGGPCTGWPT